MMCSKFTELKKLRSKGKHPYFSDALKLNDNSRSSSQSIFVKDAPTHHHPTHKDSDSLFFASNALIKEIRMLTEQMQFFTNCLVL
jgi:hypothetical protein